MSKAPITARPEPIVVDAAGGAEYVGVSRATFYRLHALGIIPQGFKIGRRRVWRQADLTEWVRRGFPGAADLGGACRKDQRLAGAIE